VDSRDLTPNEQAILLRVLDARPDYAELRAQVVDARVSGGVPTLLDLRVAESSPASAVSDGPLPETALVESPDGVKGEIIVWVTNGLLAALELVWYTEEAPAQFPDPSAVRLPDV